MNLVKPALAVIAAAALTITSGALASALDLEPPSTIGAGSFQHVSIDPATGNTLITWTEDVNTIRGQIVDKGLNVLVPTFAISSDPSQVEFSQPFAEWNPDASSWLVVWENDSAAFGRLVAPGTGATASVNVLATYADENPDFTFYDMEQIEASYGGPANGYLVAFKASLATIACQDIFGVLVDAAGAAVAPSASVLSSDTVSTDCDVDADDGLGVAYSPDADNWFVAFKNRDTGQASGRIVERSGSDVGPTTGVAELGPISAGAPTVIYDPVGAQFLTTWSDDGVIARFVSTAGVPVGASQFTVNDDTDLSPRRPRAAFDASTNSFIFVAHDEDTGYLWSWELVSGAAAPGTATLLSSDPSARPAIDAAGGCVVVAWTQDDADETVLAATKCVAVTPAGPTIPATGTDRTAELTLASFGIALLVVGGALLAARASRRAANRIS